MIESEVDMVLQGPEYFVVGFCLPGIEYLKAFPEDPAYAPVAVSPGHFGTM
jgi:hypothetical protein